MAVFLVELFVPRGEAARQLSSSLAHAEQPLRHLRTIMVPLDETAFWLVEAPSTSELVSFLAQVGVVAERIAEALEEGAGVISIDHS
jgi:hypothetical protein